MPELIEKPRPEENIERPISEMSNEELWGRYKSAGLKEQGNILKELKKRMGVETNEELYAKLRKKSQKEALGGKRMPSEEYPWFEGEQELPDVPPKEPKKPKKTPEEKYAEELREIFKEKKRVQEEINAERERIDREREKKKEEEKKESGPEGGWIGDVLKGEKDRLEDRDKKIKEGREDDEFIKREEKKEKRWWRRKFKETVGIEKKNGIRSFFGVEFTGPRMKNQAEALKKPITYLKWIQYMVYEPVRVVATTTLVTSLVTLLKLFPVILKTAKLETKILWKLTKNLVRAAKNLFNSFFEGEKAQMEDQVKFSDIWKEFFPKKKPESKE